MTIVQYFYFFFPVSGWQATVATVKPLGVQVIDAEKEELWGKAISILGWKDSRELIQWECLKHVLGKGSNNQNGNLRWIFPLRVETPPP